MVVTLKTNLGISDSILGCLYCDVSISCIGICHSTHEACEQIIVSTYILKMALNFIKNTGDTVSSRQRVNIATYYVPNIYER